MDLSHFTPGARLYLDLTFPAPPAGRPYVIINMVGSLDGKAVIETSEKGLGSPEDQDRMQELRAHADAVLNGAGTMRESGASSRLRDPELVAWRHAHGKRTDFPLGCLVTTRADFPLQGAYFDGSGVEAVIFASAITPERAREIEARGPRVVPIRSGPDGLTDMLTYLRRGRDVQLLVVEGGPTTNAELIRLNAVDEFFLTLSPTLVGGRDTITILEGRDAFTLQTVRRCALRSVVANDATNELYLRYAVPHV
jgi:riboflavin biosynthesis pyrimidine reductase